MDLSTFVEIGVITNLAAWSFVLGFALGIWKTRRDMEE